MIKRVKLTEVYTYFVDVDVDSTLEEEIRAAIDHMDCEGKIDFNKFDDYERHVEVVGHKVCKRCGTPIEIETKLDYLYYCPECDENMYGFEVEDVHHAENH